MTTSALSSTEKKVFRIFSTLKDYKNQSKGIQEFKTLKPVSVNKSLLVRGNFIAVCDTCGQVLHDEARTIPNQKYHEKVNLVSKFYGYFKLKASV